jgi:hypothetical protein
MSSSLFNDASSVIQRRMKWWQANDEFERAWKEAVVALFKALSRHLYGKT